MKHLAIITFLLSFVISKKLFAQETTFIQVHFLYGSKPKKLFKDTEPKWFGGMLGGHVGIEVDSGKILNFVPQGRFHWFARKHNKHSSYTIHDEKDFYSILGRADSVKKAVVHIPITEEQKNKLDSISLAYLTETPYDYALFGMRCGAATYDVLGKLNILPSYSYRKTWKKIFYPRKLRKRLYKKAQQEGWKIEFTTGSAKRKWEKD